MKKNFDNLLLIILWLLAMCLGTCFWLNTRYGFNMFYGPHWKYLSYAQAANLNISKGFYISIVIAIILTIVGTYIIVTPSITNKIKRIKTFKKPIQEQIPHITGTPAQQTTTDSLVRPPHPNTPVIIQTAAPIQTHQQQPITNQQTNIQPANTYTDELKQIFEQAGYAVKDAPTINGIHTSLFAAGTNEIIYVGAVGITHNSMNSIIDKLQSVFNDTLDDIQIEINAFIIAPSDNSSDDNIMVFATPDELRDYIQEHQNPPIPDDDDGNFDAFSSFISTVAEYIGNI